MYHRKEKIYYLWKTLYKDNTPVAFKSICHGSHYDCLKYSNENKLKLKEKIYIA